MERFTNHPHPSTLDVEGSKHGENTRFLEECPNGTELGADVEHRRRHGYRRGCQRRWDCKYSGLGYCRTKF